MATLLEFAGVHYFTKVLSNMHIFFKEFAYGIKFTWEKHILEKLEKQTMQKNQRFILIYFENEH